MTTIPSLPQTNLQLYALMQERGYGEEALDAANRAYLLVAKQTCGILRGSGKPFCCHLVGTAAILVHEDEPADMVTAGLLHAAYQNRVPFLGQVAIEPRRRYIREAFGGAVEDLVNDYHHFEMARLDGFSDEQLAERRNAVMIRVADELEDMLDHGVAMHGKPADDAAVGGSAASRQAQKAALANDYLRAARIAGAPFIEQQLLHWLRQTADVQWPPSLRTGEYSSFQVGQPIW